MSYIIIEECLNGKIKRILKLNKEDINVLSDIEPLYEETKLSIEFTLDRSKEIKKELKDELEKSEYEISGFIDNPTLNTVYNIVSHHLGFHYRLKLGYRTAIDTKNFGLYTKATIEALKKALESDKNVKVKVYLKKEGKKYILEKEEIVEKS